MEGVVKSRPDLGSWVELIRSGECAEELVDPGGSFGFLLAVGWAVRRVMVRSGN